MKHLNLFFKKGLFLLLITWMGNKTYSQCYGEEGAYSPDNITGKVVAGDFDNDGHYDDIGAFYDYGANTSLHIWINGTTYQGDLGWWNASFNSDNIIGKVVSGDFDNDGYHDDIAAIDYYGSLLTKINVWCSNGSAFTYADWLTMTVYNGNLVTNRVVSGDFDNDGYHDDIVGFQHNGGFTAKLQVWKSNGSSFASPSTWVNFGSYDVNKITGKMVSGDFDQDGYIDDVTVFYDYGANHMQTHTWLSNGSGFGSNLYWFDSYTYNAENITGRVVSGDFDRDGFYDDIAAFYDYGVVGGTYDTHVHVWKSTGSDFIDPTTNGWWPSDNYNSNNITYRVVTGAFTPVDGYYYKDDIAGFYKHDNTSVNTHAWYGSVSSFTASIQYGLWGVCDNVRSLEVPNQGENIYHNAGVNTSNQTGFDLAIYPNPASNEITITIRDFKILSGSLTISDMNGRVVLNITNICEVNPLSIEQLSPGMYIVQLNYTGGTTTQKFIKQ